MILGLHHFPDVDLITQFAVAMENLSAEFGVASISLDHSEIGIVKLIQNARMG